jgi:hypothetical protein
VNSLFYEYAGFVKERAYFLLLAGGAGKYAITQIEEWYNIIKKNIDILFEAIMPSDTGAEIWRDCKDTYRESVGKHR